MNRRKFGLLAGSSLAATATGIAKPALAQPYNPDPSLLTTVLTPLGGERAGNADGSIPAWTGGIVSGPLPPGTPADVPMFEDEQPLYTVDASNLPEYRNLLTEGTQVLMTKFGFRIKVYKSHRTAAAPQYVYDNTAKNVTRAKLEPSGGRFGFTGAYGGSPFPIINTSEPYIGGVQLIWNHLLNWAGYSYRAKFAPGFVITGKQVVNTSGDVTHYLCPYYDPNGSAETYEGYFYKLKADMLTPPSQDGGESIVWHSSNTLLHPDITWSLVNGQGRVRKAPDEAYDTPNPSTNGLTNFDDSSCFYGSPQKYDWKFIDKREMLIPYNCNASALATAQELVRPGFPNVDLIRWEKHRVWIVEATLHPGERNTSARRMCYIDEDAMLMVLTDMYDADNNMVKTGVFHPRCVPSLPGQIGGTQAFWNIATGDYTITGPISWPPHYQGGIFIEVQPAELFDPQQMAASASF